MVISAHLDTVFCDGRYRWRFDDLRVDGYLDRFKDIATRQVNRRGPLKVQVNIGLVR